jgi:hypothetical protein
VEIYCKKFEFSVVFRWVSLEKKVAPPWAAVPSFTGDEKR